MVEVFDIGIFKVENDDFVMVGHKKQRFKDEKYECIYFFWNKQIEHKKINQEW